MIRRLCKLIFLFAPLVALYPVHLLIKAGSTAGATPKGQDAHQVVLDSLEQGQVPEGPLGWYYQALLYAVESGGAALIKIMQWAGSRPDMFGQEFCAVFSQLQDNTTPHKWAHTERAMIEAYGENWRDHIELGEILGSGCIAQVYKGSITMENGENQLVAIKVMHPNVEDDIDADLDILRAVLAVLEGLEIGAVRDLKWLNLPGFIEEMAGMLKIQLDLRTEGEHLEQFNKNFKGNESIAFPNVVEQYPPTKNVLVETFCEGVPIMEFIQDNKADRELLSKKCVGAIKAVCQMIFLGKFVSDSAYSSSWLQLRSNC